MRRNVGRLRATVRSGSVSWRGPWNGDPSCWTRRSLRVPSSWRRPSAIPPPYVARIHAAGARVACQVQDRRSAVAAQKAGADLVVAQGTEAGGHTGAVGTLPLLQIV